MEEGDIHRWGVPLGQPPLGPHDGPPRQDAALFHPAIIRLFPPKGRQTWSI